MSNLAEVNVLSEVLGVMEATLKIPADQVDVDANLESFGVNSLIVMELMENIEKRFDVTLTPSQFSNIDTVRGLADLIDTLLSKESGAADGSPSATGGKASSGAQPAAQWQQTPGATTLREGGGFGGSFGGGIGGGGLVSGNGLSPAVLDHLRAAYDIDFSGRSFSSIDDVVDTLLSKHSGELLRHYGLSGHGAGAAGPAQAPVIAIVGMSCRLPDARDHHAFWLNLLERRNSMREIPQTRWNWQDHYSETIAPGKTVSKWGALIDGVDCFDARFFNIAAEEAKTIDPQLRLLLEETYRAVEDAGINMKNLGGSRTGVFIGYEYSEYEHHLRRLGNDDVAKGPLFSSSSPSYYLSNRISYTYDLCGPSESYNVNCASSAVAINRACYSLLNRESDLAVAGAASLNLFADDYIAASQYGVLSSNGTSGVFDDDANGFTRGEGVAMVVLKRLEDAEKDNDRIYGIIRSSHQNYRGAARNISEVRHESITGVIAGCYDKAGIDPETVDYVEVDGYASKWADSFEYEGLRGAFTNGKTQAKHVALGSVKGNIGNVESVSGVTNVIKIALSLHHKTFPATISVKKVNTFMDVDSASHPLYIADRELAFDSIRRDPGKPIRAGVNSFADSGTNVHILLEEYLGGGKPPANSAAQGRQLFVLSAKDNERLASYVQRYIDFLSAEAASCALADLAFTSQLGREPHAARLAIVASSCRELMDKLALVRKTGIKDKLGLDSREIYFGRTDPSEKNSLASLISSDMARMQLVRSQQTAQWKEAALLWVNGVAMPWEAIWRPGEARRVSLPTYPFAGDRHWFDIGIQDVPGEQVAPAAPERQATRPLVQEERSAAGADAPAGASDAWHFFVPVDAARIRPAEEALSRTEKVELFLKQEVARQQGRPIDEIASDKDFIELGLNSVGVAELIIKADKLLQTNLSPSVLFKHPEIGRLSEYLAEAFAEELDALVVTRFEPLPEEVRIPGAHAAPPPRLPLESGPASPQDILIPLQAKGGNTGLPGSFESPIFAVPGAGGNALSLQQLSHALGKAQPFYCLEPVGLDGRRAPSASVEQAAELNVRALQSVQPTGPYRLLGYSNGGIVAFEMTRQLLQRGERVASLVMLDTLCPSLLNQQRIEAMTVAVFNHFIASLGAETDLDVGQLQRIPEGERSEYLYRHVCGLGLELPRQQFIATFEVAVASELACRAYLPAKLGDEVNATLFRATAGFEDQPADYGWGAFLAGDLQVRDIDADHFTLTEKTPAMEVARSINHPPPRPSRKTTRDRAGVAA